MIKKLPITCIASLSLFGSLSHAWVQPAPLIGGICRTGVYFSFVAPMSVGASAGTTAGTWPVL